jgi:hypothetical protein
MDIAKGTPAETLPLPTRRHFFASLNVQQHTEVVLNLRPSIKQPLLDFGRSERARHDTEISEFVKLVQDFGLLGDELPM